MKKYDELINKMGDKEFTSNERQLVNDLIVHDHEFACEVEAQKDIIRYLKHRKQKLQLETYHQEMLAESENTQFVPFRKAKWLGAFFAIFFVIAIIYSFISLF